MDPRACSEGNDKMNFLLHTFKDPDKIKSGSILPADIGGKEVKK